MDKRIEKTKIAIRNAFMELRSKRALENITVKELCELANINKSTFYSHYRDIYNLSDAMEHEAIIDIVNTLPHPQEYSLFNPELFTKDVVIAFHVHRDVIRILFSGNESHSLGYKLEKELKKVIFSRYPQLENDIEKNIILTYCIQGAYHAQMNNYDMNFKMLLKVVGKITKTLQPLFNS